MSKKLYGAEKEENINKCYQEYDGAKIAVELLGVKLKEKKMDLDNKERAYLSIKREVESLETAVAKYSKESDALYHVYIRSTWD